MIRTLIVEDDFRVAELHATFVSRVEGFEVVGTTHTMATAFQAILTLHPQLILLDLFLPDQHGLELLSKLSQLPRGKKIDVFIISAARDSVSVKEALQLGAANYLVKPFSMSQLAQRLIAYKAAVEKLSMNNDISQSEVDQIASLLRGNRVELNQGGGKNPTIESIKIFLAQSKTALSAHEVGIGVGISRATAQRYLSQMVDRKLLVLELQYGTAGRPINLYRNAT